MIARNGQVPVRSVWVEAPGGRMHAFAAEGALPENARDVVLVHGLVVAGCYMLPLLEKLASSARVYAVDLPGYGRSYKPPRALALEQLADSLALWMDLRRLSKAHFIGNSFGCQILAEFAVRHPERVEKLVLQGPTLDPRYRGAVRPLVPFAMNGLKEPLSLGPLVMKEYLQTHPQVILDTFRACISDAVETKLPKVEAPTLVVRGSKDPIAPQDWTEEVVRLLPRGELKVLPGLPHTINYTGPLELARVVRPFLDLN